jgi:MFS transporter, PHS family, inorganic phosphate transporter
MIILACAGRLVFIIRSIGNTLAILTYRSCKSIPGYWTAVLTIDTLGRKPLQIFGFIILTIIFCILGFAFYRLSEAAMLALYVTAQFFFNWGPNTTTFIVPGECYPTRYRSTGHGLSAAMGKLGAILAQVISIPILAKDSPPDCHGHGSAACSPWIDRLMQIFALFMLCGTFVSILIPETKGVTLEELAGEAPTGYNAERRADAHPPTGWQRWNPFLGGQPAGFFYAKAVARERRQLGGIMTSPEIAAQEEQMRRRLRNKSQRQRRTGSGGIDGDDYLRYGGRPSTSSSMARANMGDPRLPATPPSVLPGWGAGWGRVEGGRGYADGDRSFRMQDVGNLLR